MPERRRRPDRSIPAASPATQRQRLAEIRSLSSALVSALYVTSEVGLVQTAGGEANRTPHVSRPTEGIATSPAMAAQRRRAADALRDADSHILDALSSLRAAQAALARPFAGGPPGGMKDGSYPGAMPREELSALQRHAQARQSRGEE